MVVKRSSICVGQTNCCFLSTGIAMAGNTGRRSAVPIVAAGQRRKFSEIWTLGMFSTWKLRTAGGRATLTLGGNVVSTSRPQSMDPSGWNRWNRAPVSCVLLHSSDSGAKGLQCPFENSVVVEGNKTHRLIITTISGKCVRDSCKAPPYLIGAPTTPLKYMSSKSVRYSGAICAQRT
jgi:hypothetical protein